MNSILLFVNNRCFWIWRHELLQTFHCFLRSFLFRWVTLDPIGMKILRHDWVLQMRFVFITENFVTRHCGSPFFGMVNTVSFFFGGKDED